jgi:glutamyl-tRNA reductase
MSSRPKTLLFLLGANHRSAPMEMREQLFIPPERLSFLLPELKLRFGFLELAAISTCNRFELIGVAPTGQDGYGEAALYEAYFELQKAAQNLQKINDASLKESLYLYLNRDAVNHIHRVAASLDSLVLGETQITGQFKNAIALALETKTIGPTLTRLSQEALATAKKIRSQTAIGQKHVSISHAAIELAKKVFGDLSAHKFLIIGAGEMAQVAAKYIKSYNPKAIFIANRTVSKAQGLASQLLQNKKTKTSDVIIEAFSLDELQNLLPEVDIVLSSTSATGVVLGADMVKRAQMSRRNRPLFLIDIALPRDIDPACSAIDDVYLFDIDDLQQVVGANYEERRVAAEEAQAFIDRSVGAFEHWLDTFAVKPALAGFRAFINDIFAKEMAKTYSKEHFKDLSPRQKDSITALLDSLAAKISAEASKQVKAPPEGHFPEQLAVALSVLFPCPQKGDTANSQASNETRILRLAPERGTVTQEKKESPSDQDNQDNTAPEGEEK